MLGLSSLSLFVCLLLGLGLKKLLSNKIIVYVNAQWRGQATISFFSQKEENSRKPVHI
jgi:hypothetical protein